MAPRESRPPASARPTPFDRMALTYLARQDRSEAEVRRFLTRRGASPPAIETVLRRLVRHGYVNDQAFAERWAQRRVTRRPVGRIRLEHELLTKGVERETARRAVDRVLEGQSERDLAQRLLAQRFAARPPRSLAHAMAVLTRHGFDPDVIETLRDRMGLSPEEAVPAE